MNFEIINSKKIEKFLLKVKKVNINTLEINFRDNKNVIPNNELSLNELIEKLNNEDRLNPIQLNNKIEILFEDFDTLGKFIHNVKKIFSRTVGSIDIANYNIEDCKVRVYSDVLKPNFYNEELQKSYDKILDNGDNNNFIIKFFILHEVGHAIHHALLNDLNYKEFSGCFNNFYLNTNNGFKKFLSLIVRENFADLYATVSLLILDSQDNKLINNLEKMIEYRLSNLNERYHTYNGLSLILEKFKNNELKIDSFKSVMEIITEVTEIEIKNRLKLDLENSSVVSLGEKLGYLDRLFEINSSDDKLILKKLKEELNFNPQIGYLFNKEDFNVGKIVETNNNNKVKLIKSLDLILNKIDMMRNLSKDKTEEFTSTNKKI